MIADLRNDDQITLLGIALLDPTNEWVLKADLVISTIRELLARSPDISSVSVDFVAGATKLPREEVAVVFKKLANLGYFHTSGSNYGHGIDGWLTVTIDKKSFDGYLRFESLKDVLDMVVDDERDLVNRATEEQVQEVLQSIKTLRDALTSIWVKAIDQQDLEGAIEDLQAWKVKVTAFLRANISEAEARELQKITQKFPLVGNLGDLDFRICKYEERLKALAKEIQDDPTVLSFVSGDPEPKPIDGNLGRAEEQPAAHMSLVHANQLYAQAKSLIEDRENISERDARIVVELADDAIKEFGSTNQEKRVELKRWKDQAELVLPPLTLEQLRKRAEGEFLKTSYPRNLSLRNVLFGIIILVVFVLGIMSFKWALSDSNNSKNTNLSSNPISSGTDYWGRVVDAVTRHVISGAKISVESNGPGQIYYYSDSEGVFSLRLVSATQTIHMRVDAEGYIPFERNASISRTGVEEIRLTPIPPPTSSSPNPSPKPNESPNTPTSDLVLEKVAGDGQELASASWMNFTLKVLDNRGRVVVGAKVAWQTPDCGTNMYVDQTDQDGLSSATNMCNGLFAGTHSQLAILIEKDSPTGFTVLNMIKPLGKPAVFTFKQK